MFYINLYYYLITLHYTLFSERYPTPCKQQAKISTLVTKKKSLCLANPESVPYKTMSIWHRWYTTTPINRLGSELLKGYTFTLLLALSFLLFYLLIKCFAWENVSEVFFESIRESLWETPTENLPTLNWFCYFVKQYNNIPLEHH